MTVPNEAYRGYSETSDVEVTAVFEGDVAATAVVSELLVVAGDVPVKAGSC